MRYFWCGIALLAVLILGCWLSLQHLNDIIDQSLSFLDLAHSALSESRFDSAYLAVQDANALWHSHDGFLGTILRHDESDALAVEFESLLASLSLEDSENAYPSLQSVRAMLEHIARMEYPYPENFL